MRYRRHKHLNKFRAIYSDHDDDESDNHDETKPFTCDDHDDDESDKSLAIKRC